ncbi:MAG: putative FKBP-type peptidyl-prolyl cis-trans isomerase [Candidatus Heimdallarchaeota archaeon LC_3]|nr:MAG: putative FKBP-type peptidyl-prolyl cis-trans isomerase [Candidatus Heimdallarchaeota archaeon LC_3]
MVKKLVKEGDCAYITFTGKNKTSGKIFSTTSEEIAKKNDLYDKKNKYGSVFVIIGKGSLMSALEKGLIGKAINKELTITVPSKDGFGRYDPSKIESVSVKRLKDVGVKPVKGAIVRTKEKLGIVTSVSSGRATVDFNHELAGKDLEFNVIVERLIDEKDEKVSGLVDHYFTGLKPEEDAVSLDSDTGLLSVELPLVHLFNQNNAMKSFQFFNDITYLMKDDMKKLELKFTFDMEGFNKIANPDAMADSLEALAEISEENQTSTEDENTK